MKGGWVAGVTRGRLLLSRAIGTERARAIAGAGSLQEAQAALAGSAYGERVPPGADLQAAERGVADTLLWHLRILAGWLPSAGAGLVRALAGWFELANIDALLAASSSRERAAQGAAAPSQSRSYSQAPFVLGGLATAWPRIEHAASVQEIAQALAGSPWGEVGGRSPAALALGLRIAWARRVIDAAPESTDWVAGAGALLLARTTLLSGSPDAEQQLRKLPAIGEHSAGARSLQELRGALSAHAAWALAGAQRPEELWLAELGWWQRVQQDALMLLRGGSDEATVLAVVALLGVDAQHTVQALRAAAQGGAPHLVELVAGNAGLLAGAGGPIDAAR